MSFSFVSRSACCFLLCLSIASASFAADKLPLVASDNFDGKSEEPLEKWELLDSKENWSIETVGGTNVLNQVNGKKRHKGPHRSPYYTALLKNAYVGDFVLTAKVRSTSKRMNNHRDACLFFGFQDPAHLYYVHLGLKSDPHANQIFIVHEADRKMITKKQSPGTPWDEKWHQVKIVRRVKTGDIEIYFDDMKTPVMTAVDKRLKWGRVGVGTFDDVTQWDDIQLRGTVAKPPKNHVLPSDVSPVAR